MDDVYAVGDIFSSTSEPTNSDFYNNVYTGAYLEVLDTTPEKATIKAGFRDPDLSPAPFFDISIVKGVTNLQYHKPDVYEPGVNAWWDHLYDIRVTAGKGGELIPIEELTIDNHLCKGTGTLSSGAVDERSNPLDGGVVKEEDISKIPQNGPGRFVFQDGYVTWKGKPSRATVSEPVYVDTRPPEITLKGSNPQYLAAGQEYTEFGAEVTDNLDPEIEGKLTIDSSAVNTAQAGTYTVTYSAEDWAGNKKTVTRTVEVEAPPPASIAIAPGAKSLTYTGAAQELVTRGTASGGTMEYSLSEDGGYSEEIPMGTDAGEYTVWYRVTGDETHSDLAPASLKVTISKAAQPGNIPEDVGVPAGTALSSLHLPSGWSWKDPNQVLVTGANQVTVVYADTENYEQTEFTITVTMAEPVHTHSLVKTPAKAPTCAEEGNLEYWTCSGCGSIFADEAATAPTTAAERALGKVGHTPGGEPDCNHAKRCTVCDIVLKPALGHSYQQKVTRPTCTTGGYSTYTCTRCGDSFRNGETAALGHTAGAAATCTEAQCCTVCYAVLSQALGHDYSKATVTDPTCTEKGYTTHTCTQCGASYTDSETDALDHNWGAWTETKAADCTTKGEEQRKCTRCDVKETRETNALDHDFVGTVTEPTCTERGYTTHTCSRCEASYIDTYVAAPGHDWGPWTELTAPTTENPGEKRRECSRCGEAETAEIPMHLHTEVVDPAKDATCTETGLTEGKHCSVCGTVLIKQETVPALDHNWGAWTETKAADCVTKGEEQQECSRCRTVETREIPALGHDYSEVTVTAPTCTEQGYTTHTCSRCRDSYTDSETTALGHDWGAWTETRASTCTEKGEEQRTCSRCGTAETRELPLAEHTPGGWETVTQATTEQEGLQVKKCTECGEELERETIPKLAPTPTPTPTPDPPSPPSPPGPPSPPSPPSPPTPAEPTPTPTPSTPEFVDVPGNAYYAEAVSWAVEKGVTTGTSAVRFSPDSGCTRAQAVTFLWRAAGKPEPTVSYNPFVDVKPGQYYYTAVLWAVQNGVTNGTDSTHFSPDKTCTRAQIVSFLYRSEGSPNVPADGTFGDVPGNAYYAGAVSWAVKRHITTGTSAVKFSPDGTCTRAQIVTFLWRDYTG